jgi:hypothetical protein
MMAGGLIGDDSAVSLLTVRKTWATSPSAGVSVALAVDQRVPLLSASPPAWLT